MQLFQIAETGIACTKVINGNMNTCFFPFTENSVALIEITQMHAFCNLERQSITRSTKLLHNLEHSVGKILLMQLHIGYIHIHAEMRIMLTPFQALLDSLTQHPHADRTDQLCLFQHRNKLHRAQQSSTRRIITQKRLRPQQTVILTIDQRLIAEKKALAVVAHAVAQLILQLHPAQMLLIACLRKKDDFLMVILFRTFQRHLSTLDYTDAINISLSIKISRTHADSTFSVQIFVELSTQLLHILMCVMK